MSSKSHKICMACNCRCPYYFLLNPRSVYNQEIRIYHWDFASETREERQRGDPDCLDSHVRLSGLTLGVRVGWSSPCFSSTHARAKAVP